MIPLPEPGVQMQPQEGLKVWRNPINGFLVVQIHYTADPARRGPWKYRASPKYGGLRSWRWRKEQEIDWEAQAGSLVFELWGRKHQIDPFLIPDHWPKWILFDPGWRNPSSIVWVAVDTDAQANEYGFLPVHVYREFYKPKHSARACAVVCSEYSRTRTDPEGNATWEWIEEIIVDPAAKQEHQGAAGGDKVNEAAETTLEKFTEAIEELGWDVPIDTGNNYKQEPIEEIIARLGCYWIGTDGLPLYDDADKFREATLEEIADGAVEVQPTLFFHGSVVEGAREMAKYRWRDWASGDVAERHNNPESPVDKDDHTVTNLIRFINLLRSLRVENGPDLSDFQPRERPRAWKPPETVVEERHRTLAGRYRRRMRRAKRGL